MRKVSRRHPLEPKEPIEPRLSSPTDDADDFEDDVEELSLQDEQTSAYLRNEARNERMHVRVQLPFQVVINGRRFAGHDISVSGFSTAKRPAVDGRAPVQCDLYIRCNGFRAAIPTVAQMLGEREEHTSELQSLMRISYAVFCLKKKKQSYTTQNNLYDNDKRQTHTRS